MGVALFDIPISAIRLRHEIQDQINAALGRVAPLFVTTIRHSIAVTRAARSLHQQVRRGASGQETTATALILSAVNSTHSQLAAALAAASGAR